MISVVDIVMHVSVLEPDNCKSYKGIKKGMQKHHSVRKTTTMLPPYFLPLPANTPTFVSKKALGSPSQDLLTTSANAQGARIVPAHAKRQCFHSKGLALCGGDRGSL